MRHVDAFSPHLIVTSTQFPERGWAELAKGSRRVILSMHNTFWAMGRPQTGLKNRVKKRLLARHARSLANAICISRECARQLDEVSGGQIGTHVVIPQMHHMRKWQTSRGLTHVIYVGRIEYNKGVMDLLEAFKKIKVKAPNLTLSYIGDGSFLPQLTAAAAQVDGVQLLGRLGAEGVHQKLAESDLLVCPTRTEFNEGLAVVGFEAASHGIPSIQSSVVPAHETLGQACMVFEANNAVDLQNKIETLLDTPETYEAMKDATHAICENVMNRDLSWGAQLAKAMADV